MVLTLVLLSSTLHTPPGWTADGTPFPVHPGSKRMAMPDLPATVKDIAVARFVDPAQSSAIYDWYVAELTRAGWQIPTKFGPQGPSQHWQMMASAQEGGRQAMLQGQWNAETKQTLYSATLKGPGVTSDSFGTAPPAPGDVLKPPAPEEPAPAEEEGGEQEKEPPKTMDELLEALDGINIPGVDLSALKAGATAATAMGFGAGAFDPENPPGPEDWEEMMATTPPNDFQQAINDFQPPFEAVIEALDKWCRISTSRNLNAALAAIEVYFGPTERLKDKAAARADEGLTAAATLYIHNSLADIQIGYIGWTLEQIKTDGALRFKLKPVICGLMEDLKTKDRAWVVAACDRAYKSEELAKREEKPDDLPPQPVTLELLAESGEPDFEPSTTVHVTRQWTPSTEFWDKQLARTWISLKSWKQGCPDDCKYEHRKWPLDDLILCKAWGEGPKNWEKHQRVGGYAGSAKDYETRVARLSLPLTLYGMAAVMIEVGDPKQMEQGGQLDVLVDGLPLMTVGLVDMTNPYYPARSPWHNLSHPGHAEMAAYHDRVAQSVQATYCREAEQHFRNGVRIPWAVTEATGGDFNGYIGYVPIGVGYVRSLQDPAAPGLLPPVITQPAQVVLNLHAIARASHPALESPHTIALQATVGGVKSDIVTYDVPAVFDDLAAKAGVWGAWPGDDNPAEWVIGQELTPHAVASAPAKLSINEKAAAKLMEDSKKFARAHELLILKNWLDKIKDLALDSLTSYLNLGDADATTSKLKGFFKEGTNGKLIHQTYKKFCDWLKKDAGQDILSDVTDWTCKKALSDFADTALTDTLGTSVFHDAESLRALIDIRKDRTSYALTRDARLYIILNRWHIWIAGQTALKVHEDWDKVDSPLEEFGDLIENAFGPAAKNVLIPLKGFRYGGQVGLLIVDIQAIMEIEKELALIRDRLEKVASYRRP